MSPPASPEVALELDPSALSTSARYRWLISLVVPRPIAFVSTQAPDGSTNLAPFSYFMGVSSDPFLVAISVTERDGRPKDTAHNLATTGEFVVNAAGEEHAAQVARAGGDWDPDVDEFALVGLTKAPSVRVAPPRVLESAFSLECRVARTIELGASPRRTSLVLGEVVWMHVAERVLVDGAEGTERLADPTRLRPLARLGGNLYTGIGPVFALDRPRARRPEDEPPA